MGDQPEKRVACAACGHEHGSVNAWIICLTREVVRLRDDLRTAMLDVARLRAPK